MKARGLVPAIILIAQLAVGVFFGALLQPPPTTVADLNIPGLTECKPLRGGGFDSRCIDRNDRLIRDYLLTMRPEPASLLEQRRLFALPTFFVLGIAAFATTWRVFGAAGAAFLAVVYLIGRITGALGGIHLYLTAFAWIVAAVMLRLLKGRHGLE